MVPITCAACGKAAEFDERWRGCLRPCPHCGSFVEVPEDSRLVEGPVPVEPRCFCGSEQVDPESGLWYRVSFDANEEPVDGPVKYVAAVLVVFGGLIGCVIALAMLRSRRIPDTAMRWVCADCRGQVRRAALWGSAGTALTLLLFVLLPIACLVLAQTDAGERRLSEYVGDPRFVALAAVMLGPVVGYFAFYRLGMLLLAPGLSAAYARSWDLLPIEEARSPVLRYPDGTYAPTYRTPAGPAPKG